MIHIVKRNDDPPLSDDAMEALMDDIYEQFERHDPHTYIDDEHREVFAVWIADRVTAAYGDGYDQGRTDSKDAMEQGYFP